MAIYFKSMLLNLKKQVAEIHTSFRGCQRIEWDTGITCASFNKVRSLKMGQWVKALVATLGSVSSFSITHIKV